MSGNAVNIIKDKLMLSDFSFRKLFAFFKRDYLVTASYKLHFVSMIVNIFVSTAIFYFIAKGFGEKAQDFVVQYGPAATYFTFVIIGICINMIQGERMATLSSSIREAQMLGTLEALLVSPTRISVIILASSLWNFFMSIIQVLGYLLVAWLFFGFNMQDPNIFGAIIVLFLSLLSFTALGIISASFVMIFKKGDPTKFVIGTLSSILGGVYFPVIVITNDIPWLLPICKLLPLYHSLEALRYMLLGGASIGEVRGPITALVIFAFILLPLSVMIFRYAIRRAKIVGSLIQY